MRENAFELKEKKPGLSANRLSNNWAQNKLIIAFIYHFHLVLLTPA